MARKRIKTLATEWGVSVNDLLASCARLHLTHAHSESNLLSREDTERIKNELEEHAQRAAAIPRETVVETSAGTIFEKRLNANVMRRRHSEPAPGPAAPESSEPFQFEPGPSQSETSFVAPVFDEPPKLEAEFPELPSIEPEPSHLSPEQGPGREGRAEQYLSQPSAHSDEAAAPGLDAGSEAARSGTGRSFDAQSETAPTPDANAEAERGEPEGADSGRSQPTMGNGASSATLKTSSVSSEEQNIGAPGRPPGVRENVASTPAVSAGRENYSPSPRQSSSGLRMRRHYHARTLHLAVRVQGVR